MQDVTQFVRWAGLRQGQLRIGVAVAGSTELRFLPVQGVRYLLDNGTVRLEPAGPGADQVLGIDPALLPQAESKPSRRQRGK